MDKAEADAALARLQRAERAHARNQNALTHALTRHEHDITRLTGLVRDLDAAIGRRQDTRGDKFAMTVDGRAHGKRAAAGQHLKHLLQQQAAELDGPRVTTATPGHLGGFPLTAAAGRVLGKTTITVGLDGAPGTSIRLDEQELSQADPAGLITRLENRLARLEDEKAGALAGIGRAQREIAHAHDSIGKPFPQAGQLAAARERARRINDELDQMAAPPQADDQPGKEPSTEPASTAGAAAREPASQSTPAPAARQEGHALPPGPASDPARLASRPAADPGNGHHHPRAGQAREVTAEPRAAVETPQPHEHTQDRDTATTAAAAEDPAPARYGAGYPGSRRPERQHDPQAQTTPADPEAGS